MLPMFTIAILPIKSCEEQKIKNHHIDYLSLRFFILRMTKDTYAWKKLRFVWKFPNSICDVEGNTQ